MKSVRSISYTAPGADKAGRAVHRKRGFTLIELLVVIAVIVVLMSMLFPLISASRVNARRVEETNHLRQIGLACHAFQGIHRSFPSWGGDPFDDFGEDLRGPAVSSTNEKRSLSNQQQGQHNGPCSLLPDPGRDTGPRSQWGPFYQILPHLAQKPLYDDAREDCYAADKARGVGVEVFQSPLSAAGAKIVNLQFGSEAGLTLGTSAFAFCSGAVDVDQFGTSDRPGNGAIGPPHAPTTLLQFPDGTSNTLLAGTKYVDAQAPAGEPQPGNELGWWAGQSLDTVRWIELLRNSASPQANYQSDNERFLPEPNPPRALPFGGGHPAGGQFLFADGRVRHINFIMADPGVLRAAATRNGHETIDSEAF